MWEKSDEDGCGGEEKERKTEAEVDGQCECGLEGEGTGMRGGNLSDTSTIHRSGKGCGGRRITTYLFSQCLYFLEILLQ